MKAEIRGFVVSLLVGAAAVSPPVTAQPACERPPDAASAGIPEALSVLAPLFFPKVIQDVYQLKEYVRSEEFAAQCRLHGDTYAVDLIYAHSLRLCWGNRYEALFAALVATMDHARFGVKIPLIGPVFWVPLTSEWDDEFAARLESLPRRPFPDSPPDSAGDRDKLQHFFGSAFLTYLFDSPEAAGRFGAFVEWGEDAFIVGGVYDARDVEANHRGQLFGIALRRTPGALPSTFFRVPLSRTMEADSVGFQSEE